MFLFHGSNIAIKTVDLSRCRPYKDFGQGFYLTAIEEQAILMAKRTTMMYGGEPVVIVFEFDEAAALKDTSLSIKYFSEPDEEWALFVLNNRSHKQVHPVHRFDIVIGPVADNTIVVPSRDFFNGIIDLPSLINSIKYDKISSQYFFHSQKAIAYLK